MAHQPRITSSDLFARAKKPRPGEELSRGNVALQVHQYQRGSDERVRAVTGSNLATGEIMTIKLASADDLADYYSDLTKERPLRLEEANKRIANRVPLEVYANAKGKYATPADEDRGGVIAFDAVKADLKRPGEFYAGWLNALVQDRDIETTLTGHFEVAERLTEFRDGEQTKKERTASVSMLFADQTIVGGSRPKLDGFLTGKLPNTDQDVSGQTFVAVTVYPAAGDPGVALTGRLYSPPARSSDGAIIGRQAGIEAALTGGVFKNVPAAMAATAAAATARIPFERLKFEDEAKAQKEGFKDLYDGVLSGRHKVGFTPGINLSVGPEFKQKLFNPRKLKDGRELPTHESLLVNRGYVRGTVAARFFSPMQNRYVTPAVKAISTVETYSTPANDPATLKEGLSKVCQDVIDSMAPTFQDDVDYDAGREIEDDDPYAEAGYSGSSFSPD